MIATHLGFQREAMVIVLPAETETMRRGIPEGEVEAGAEVKRDIEIAAGRVKVRIEKGRDEGGVGAGAEACLREGRGGEVRIGRERGQETM